MIPSIDPRYSAFTIDDLERWVDITPGCWLWTGAKNWTGYGQRSVRVDGKVRTARAHRMAYELLVGPIPEGLTIDHLCRVRHCVNPDHLEPVTMKENARRGVLARTGAPVADHGTRSAYVRGCRCEECAAANRAYSSTRRASAEAPAQHGVLSSYTNGRCRCADCRAAMRDYQAHRRAKVAS